MKFARLQQKIGGTTSLWPALITGICPGPHPGECLVASECFPGDEMTEGWPFIVIKGSVDEVTDIIEAAMGTEDEE